MENNQNNYQDTSIDSTRSYETGVWNNLKIIFQQQVPNYIASVEQGGGSRTIKDLNGLLSFIESSINNSLNTYLKQKITISKLKNLTEPRIKADKPFVQSNINTDNIPFEITNHNKNNESMNTNKKLIRLTESDLHRIVKESVKRVLRESDFLNNKIPLTDDNYMFLKDAELIANEWFNEWKSSKRSTLHSIRYADSYINIFESDDEYAEKIGDIILKTRYDKEFYQEMQPYAKYIGYYIYHLMKRYRDKTKKNRTLSISNKRKETKRKKDAATYLSRFNGYSDKVKGEMNKMWNDRNADAFDINSDEYKQLYDKGNFDAR